MDTVAFGLSLQGPFFVSALSTPCCTPLSDQRFASHTPLRSSVVCVPMCAMAVPRQSELREQRRNVYVFGLTSFMNDTASEMAYWILPAFLVSIGAGPSTLGVIEGISESVVFVAKLCAGYLVDRIERRKPVVVAGYVVANAVKPLLALA
jgi:hypothetical protein